MNFIKFEFDTPDYIKFYTPFEYTDRDYREDAEYENGNYMCTCYKCKNTFIGYKRRVICKVCLNAEQNK